MDARKCARFQVQIPISFSEVPTVGDGTVRNLSTGGCAVRSAQSVQQGMYVSLRLSLPDQDEPVKVDLAAVRWAAEGAFGVEFLQMGDEAWERIHRFMTTAIFASA